MIKNSKQNWSVGQTVKVGFMQLKVLAAMPTPGDSMPDVYFLANLQGDKVYEFTPHHGLSAVSLEEVTARVTELRRHVEVTVASQVSRAQQRAAVTAKFNELFPSA